MKKLFAVLFLCAISAWAQAPTPVPITICWTPEGGQQTCHTVQPGDVAIVTIDGRTKPIQAVVVQPLPAYQVTSMQHHVDGQIYRLQQADGSFVTKSRYTSIQDLLVQYLSKA